MVILPQSSIRSLIPEKMEALIFGCNDILLCIFIVLSFHFSVFGFFCHRGYLLRSYIIVFIFGSHMMFVYDRETTLNVVEDGCVCILS